jgi:hypothetical protein
MPKISKVYTSRFVKAHELSYTDRHPAIITRSRWGCSAMTSSKIWKSASRRDYPMSTPTDGRGRGAKADVPGNPVVDRPAAGAAGTDMRSAGSDTTNDDRVRCVSMQAI